MQEANGRLRDEPRIPESADTHAELSEADLECVIGGLARPWTEADPHEWLIESLPNPL